MCVSHIPIMDVNCLSVCCSCIVLIIGIFCTYVAPPEKIGNVWYYRKAGHFDHYRDGIRISSNLKCWDSEDIIINNPHGGVLQTQNLKCFVSRKPKLRKILPLKHRVV